MERNRRNGSVGVGVKASMGFDEDHARATLSLILATLERELRHSFLKVKFQIMTGSTVK